MISTDTARVEAIPFDMGGTLRDSVPTSEVEKRAAVDSILELLELKGSPAQWAQVLTTRFHSYLQWARENMIERNEKDLWTEWMLPDQPSDAVAGQAMELTRLWRQATGRRRFFAESRDVLLELFRRGYRLGIVSNTISRAEVPRLLLDLEIAGCLETVILSCEVGSRKPDPAILLEAAHQLGVAPERCAYVGDSLVRDVICARKAGFGLAIMRRPHMDPALPPTECPEFTADRSVQDLREVLEFFPACTARRTAQPVYDVALSTMWAHGNFPLLSDFAEGSRRLGFASIELNHHVSPAMLADTDLEACTIHSVHEPCPAEVSVEDLKTKDWLISSVNDDCRRRGLESILRSIDFAHRWQIRLVVVHCGMVSGDLRLETRLRALLDAGLKQTDEYRSVQRELVRTRATLIGPHLEAVAKSLGELLQHARSYGIRLALENRYHYFDIPGLDEMHDLLELAGPDQIGFAYDVGHAQALDRLGFFQHEEWLRRYATRMLEAHIHDVKGTRDHLAPGLGDVDFDMIARYLAPGALRILELQPVNTSDQVRSSLQFLEEHACIKRM